MKRFFGLMLAVLSVLPAMADDARTLESCGLNCGHMYLVKGTQARFRLGFVPNEGQFGIKFGNPGVVVSTLIHSGGEFQLSLAALREGKSSITVRRRDGEVAAHYDLLVGTQPRQEEARVPSGSAADTPGELATSTRVLRTCLRDCGTLVLTRGRETVFDLDFVPGDGATGFRLSNPKVAALVLVKLGNASRYELSLTALSPGGSDLILRDPRGEIVADYGLRVDP